MSKLTTVPLGPKSPSHWVPQAAAEAPTEQAETPPGLARYLLLLLEHRLAPPLQTHQPTVHLLHIAPSDWYIRA